MYLALIHPIPHFAENLNQKFKMFLAPQLLGIYGDILKPIAKACKGTKILDNGAAEGNNYYTIEQLIQCAKDIEATEFVLPDELFHKEATLKHFEEHVVLCKQEIPEVSLMAVPQGSSLTEWLECAEIMIQNKDINTIGIPKYTVNYHVKGREFLVQEVVKLKQKYKKATMSIHLLGLAYSFEELGTLSSMYVRSIDTSLPYYLQKNNCRMRIPNTGAYVDLDKDAVNPANMRKFMKDEILQRYDLSL